MLSRFECTELHRSRYLSRLELLVELLHVDFAVCRHRRMFGFLLFHYPLPRNNRHHITVTIASIDLVESARKPLTISTGTYAYRTVASYPQTWLATHHVPAVHGLAHQSPCRVAQAVELVYRARDPARYQTTHCRLYSKITVTSRYARTIASRCSRSTFSTSVSTRFSAWSTCSFSAAAS